MSDSTDPPETTALRWPRLVRQGDEPMFVLSGRRRILYVNPACETWTGLKLADIRGLSCRPGRTPTDDPAKNAILAFLAPTPETMRGMPTQVRRRSPKSPAAWCEVSFFPWKKGDAVHAILGRIQARSTDDPRKQAAGLPEKLVQLRDAQTYRLDFLDSELPSLRRVATQARLAAQSRAAVLLTGPAGSGKQWLARAIHQLGPAPDQYFACLDAARLPTPFLAEMLFTNPTRKKIGAILLKNLGSLGRDLQARLVELLRDDALAPRLFVSSADFAKESLDPDLAACVSTLTIELPSLRERSADWPRLMPTILARAAHAAGKANPRIAPETDQLLRLHDWPGNLRELFQTLRDALIRSSTDHLLPADLPFHLRNEPPPPEPKIDLDAILQSTERRLLDLALRLAQGNKSKAAEFLSIWRARVVRRAEQLGMEGGVSDA